LTTSEELAPSGQEVTAASISIADQLRADLRRLGTARRKYAVALAHRHIRGDYLIERMTETIQEHTAYIRRSTEIGAGVGTPSVEVTQTYTHKVFHSWFFGW
jgi:hypothetical protein